MQNDPNTKPRVDALQNQMLYMRRKLFKLEPLNNSDLRIRALENQIIAMQKKLQQLENFQKMSLIGELKRIAKGIIRRIKRLVRR